MNIDLLIYRIFYVYGCCAVIYSCFSFTQFYIKSFRKDDKEPAQIHEKIYMWIISLIVLAFASWAYASNTKNKLTEFVAAFIIMFIPLALGISRGFNKDKKLTVEEREKIKREIEDLNRRS